MCARLDSAVVRRWLRAFRAGGFQRAEGTDCNRLRALQQYLSWIKSTRTLPQANCHVQTSQWLDTDVVVDYLLYRQELGLSWSGPANLGAVLDAVSAAKSRTIHDPHIQPTKCGWWLTHQRAAVYHWNRSKNKHTRAPLTPEAIQKVRNSKPDTGPGSKLTPFQWNALWTIAWVFGLRKGEALAVEPHHLSEIVDSREREKWNCFVANPKITDVHNSQRVVLPTVLVPEWARHVLRRYRDGETSFVPMWKAALHKNSCCPHLRWVLGVHHEDAPRYAFHSVRHGRSVQLFKHEGLTLMELLDFGRWRSERSARMYVHAY